MSAGSVRPACGNESQLQEVNVRKSAQIFRMFEVVMLSLVTSLSVAVGARAQDRGLNRLGGDRPALVPAPQATPATMEVTPVASIIMMGRTVPVSVILKDAGGVALPDTFPVSWSSSDPSIAEVGMAVVVAPDRTRTTEDRAPTFGRVITGGRPGTALITAQAGELSASIWVTVTSSTSYYACDSSSGKCTCSGAQDCVAMANSMDCDGGISWESSTVGTCKWRHSY
jgi:hypothetical protein